MILPCHYHIFSIRSPFLPELTLPSPTPPWLFKSNNSTFVYIFTQGWFIKIVQVFYTTSKFLTSLLRLNTMWIYHIENNFLTNSTWGSCWASDSTRWPGVRPEILFFSRVPDDDSADGPGHTARSCAISSGKNSSFCPTPSHSKCTLQRWSFGGCKYHANIILPFLNFLFCTFNSCILSIQDLAMVLLY